VYCADRHFSIQELRLRQGEHIVADPYLGQLALVGFNFAPKGWAICQGQLLTISQNTALFSLIGTFYGGNGTTNFALPDLRGRIPIGAGQGPGLTDRSLGEQDGSETHTLSTLEMPVHNHLVQVSAGRPESLTTPVSDVLGVAGSVAPYAPGTSPLNQTLAPATAMPTGGNQPHENRAPYLGLNWIICMQGIFPPRN
jgi:microcystin-dependent protein